MKIVIDRFSETVKNPGQKCLEINEELKAENEELKKKLDVAISVLKRYEITDEFEGGVGYEYEDMMLACTEALKKIKEIK